MKLLFLHGWGGDASLWDGVRAALPAFKTVAWDRGYFGAPDDAPVDEPFVAIGHSLGSLLLAADPPPGCVGLIAINGFDLFTGEGRVAPRLLDRMRTRFAVAPAVVLDDFRISVGARPYVGAIATVPLAADLDRLAMLDARGVPTPKLVLHGERDPILPPAMREAVFAGAPRETLAGAGHLLPLTHPRWCAERISEALA
jgi:pimeloyl-[acyl-carrier protein] methyl ester esterase